MTAATLVLVHGAWHGSWAWQALIDALPGVDVRTVELPSSGTDVDALGDLHADVDVVRTTLAGIDGPVVVVAHSYGGLPVTEAAGATVAHLVYLCAFMLDAGDSLIGTYGGARPPWCEVHDRHMVARTPAEVFYNGVDADVTARAVEQLGVQARAATEQALTRAAWREIPSTYIVCDRDRAIPPSAQEAMAQRAGTVLHLDAGHSPFLSQPTEVATLIRPILDAASRPTESEA